MNMRMLGKSPPPFLLTISAKWSGGKNDAYPRTKHPNDKTSNHITTKLNIRKMITSRISLNMETKTNLIMLAKGHHPNYY